MNHYSFIGVVELDQMDGRQMFAVSSLVYNIPPAAKSLTKYLGINCVTEALSNVRCSRDRLAEYQAGAAKRKKASKLKIKLPDFQPVEEGEQGTLDMLYEIRNYVDPAADGSSGKIDESTCVSLYYGTKIMQRYVYLVEAGNKASDAFFESSMSLANAVFDSSLKADMPAAREKLAAALSAAKLALTKDAAPYLVLLGLDSPRWTAEDLSEMSDQLLGVLDRMIGSAQ